MVTKICKMCKKEKDINLFSYCTKKIERSRLSPFCQDCREERALAIKFNQKIIEFNKRKKLKEERLKAGTHKYCNKCWNVVKIENLNNGVCKICKKQSSFMHLEFKQIEEQRKNIIEANKNKKNYSALERENEIKKEKLMIEEFLKNKKQ